MSLRDNLISWWKLENANDAHGTNTLSATGTPTYTAGKKSNALTVTGTQKLSIPDNAALSTGNIDFTIACWVNLASKADRNAVSKDDFSGGHRDYSITFFNSTDRFRFNIWTATGGAGIKTAQADSLGSPVTGTWYFIVAWHDATADTVNIQVNDGTVNSAATAGATPFDGSTSDFCIGGRDTSTTQWWNGQIDEVGFWKRTLTAAERTWLYNSGAGRTYEDIPQEVFPSAIASAAAFGTAVVTQPVGPGGITRGLQAWWQADALTGLADGDPVASWPDSSAGGRTLAQGTSTNQPSYQTNEINGLPVVRFDGANDVLLLTSSVLADNTTPYTVFAVARPATTSDYHTVWANGSTSGHSTALRAVYTTWELNHRTSAGGEVFADEGGAVASGVPTMLTGQWDATDAVLRRDGTERARQAATTRYYADTLIAVGANVYASGYHFWQGDVGEVIVYDVALDSTEIATVEAYLTAKWSIGVQTVRPTGIASAQAVGSPLVSHGQGIRPPGIASAQALGTPRLIPAAVTVSPTGIASGEAVGSPALRHVTPLYPVGIGSGATFGTPSLTRFPDTLILPTGIPSAQAIGTATLTLAGRIVPTGIASREAVGRAILEVAGIPGLPFPTFLIEIAFASTPLEPPVWSDVTHYVQEFTVKRGRQHAADRFSAGTANLVLDNRDRRFDPTHTGGPYYPNVVPRRRVRIRASHGGTQYLFSGFVESWPQDTSQVGDATVTATCTDGFLFFTKSSLRADMLPHEERLRTDAAITWVLDHVGWPTADRDVDAGVFTVLLKADVTSVPLQLLQDISEAEAGAFYVTADGRARFLGYNTTLGAPYTGSSASFSDDGSALPYVEALPTYDDQHVWNQVVVTASGIENTANTETDPTEGNQVSVTVDDAASQAAYFVSQLSLSPPLVSLQEASALAQAYLTQYAQPRLYIGTLRHEWSGDAAQLHQMLGRELMDRITVTRHPMGGGSPMTGDYHIEQIEHHVRMDGIWETTWDLAPVPVGPPFVAGEPAATAATYVMREVVYMCDLAPIPLRG